MGNKNLGRARNAKNDELTYDLATVMEKLNFDIQDVQDILQLLEEDYATEAYAMLVEKLEGEK